MYSLKFKILLNLKANNTFLLMIIGSCLFAQNQSTKTVKITDFDSVKLYNQCNLLGTECSYKISFKKELVGILNSNNQEVYPPVFSSIKWNEANKQFVVNLDYNYGVLDTLGKWILPANFFKIVSPMPLIRSINYNAVYMVQNQDLRWGIFDKQANQLLPMEYKSFQEFYDENGYCTITDFNNKKALVNVEGLVITTFKYDDIYNPNKIKLDSIIAGNNDTYKQVFVVKNDNRFGVINETGRVILPIIFEFIDEFDSQTGLCIAKYNGFWGVINKNGDPIIKLEFKAIMQINRNLYAVKNNEKWKLVNKNGVDISKLIYDEIKILKRNTDDDYQSTAIFNQNGKFGIIDANGKEIINPIYKNIQILNNNLLLLINEKQDSEWHFGLADFEGKLLQPVEFTHYYPLISLMRYNYPIKKTKSGILQKKGEYFWIEKNGQLSSLSKLQTDALKKYLNQR